MIKYKRNKGKYKRNKENGVRIIPLGGLGEIGMNMMVIEIDKEIFIIDCGVAFPGQQVTDVDFYIPDFSYVIENSKRINFLIIEFHEIEKNKKIFFNFMTKLKEIFDIIHVHGNNHGFCRIL